jgi:hypothetical protein
MSIKKKYKIKLQDITNASRKASTKAKTKVTTIAITKASKAMGHLRFYGVTIFIGKTSQTAAGLRERQGEGYKTNKPLEAYLRPIKPGA